MVQELEAARADRVVRRATHLWCLGGNRWARVLFLFGSGGVKSTSGSEKVGRAWYTAAERDKKGT